MRRFVRLLTTLLAAAALASGLAQGIAFIAAPQAARAFASSAATGTGGQFVPAQGRVLDTRPATQVGPYSTPMPANVWRSVQVAGITMSDGTPLPSSISAVSVNISVISPSAAGYICADKDGSSPRSTAVVRYTSTDDQANTATLPVAANGKIALKAANSTNLVVEIQGYYTADDDVAPGGYVPVTPKRIRDTYYGIGGPAGKLASGSTTPIQVATADSGVPAGATAAILNITTSADTSTKNHYYVPYPADEEKPAGWSSSFPIGDTDASEVHVGLSTTGSPIGAINFYLSQASSYTVHIQVDVLGYFMPGTSKGAFTPATTRVYATGTYDTNSPKRSAIAPGATAKVQVGGINGVPLAGSGINAVAIQLNVLANGTHGGYAEMWASGKPRPSPYSSVNLARNGYFIGNLVTTQLGADGAVNIFNQSQDAIDVLVDVEGWYSSVGSAVISGQTRTQQSVTLQADPSASGSWVTYQYRVGTAGTFSSIPVSDTKDSGGATPASWPAQKIDGAFRPYTWNIRDSLAALPANDNKAPDAIVQVEACFGTSSSDASTVCDMPSNIAFSQAGDSDASTDIGPGILSELTGNFELSADDAGSISALGTFAVGRTLNTLSPADSSDNAGIFGPGWTANLSAASGGGADLTVQDFSDKHFILFTDTDGENVEYVDPEASSTYPMTFQGAGENPGDGVLVTKDIVQNVPTIVMTDSDGTRTTWTKTGSAATWRVMSVAGPGSGSTTSYCYGSCGNSNPVSNLVGRILAPTPGIDCSANPDRTPGCRSLLLNYTSSNPTRLSSISLSVPQATSSDNIYTLNQYDYDGSGRLAHAWDPRISPALKTGYSYTSANRLATLSPPGLAPWSFTYDNLGRVSTVSRSNGSGTPAINTVVYGVPLSPGDPASRPDLRTGATATWGETADLPVTGVALFAPNRVPNGMTPAAVSDDDWPFASIDYIDVNGRVVNNAVHGAGAWQVSTNQYDVQGKDLWALSAGNRAQALSPTDETDEFVKSISQPGAEAKRAQLLSETYTYDAEHPDRLTDTYGPTHPVTLDDGSKIHGRAHEATIYDEGAPSDTNPMTGESYDLPTTVTKSVYRVDGSSPADSTGVDSQKIINKYDAASGTDGSGWALGKATATSRIVAGGPNLTTQFRYDTNGRTIEERLPNDTSGSGPRTTLTTFYGPTSTGACADQSRTGLVCMVAPAGQPSSGPPLPTTTNSYNAYGEPVSVVETFGAGSAQVARTYSTAYDNAMRPATYAIAVSPSSAGGVSVPTVNYSYSDTTGLLVGAQTGSGSTLQRVSTGYDSFARPTSYTDATGTISTTSYDLDSRPVTHYDGKTTSTFRYDTSTEHRGVVTSENIGVSGAPSDFSATYNADGDVAKVSYPNGLVAQRSYDTTGFLTDLTYVKDSSTWMAFKQSQDSGGRVAQQHGPNSEQRYRYDAIGRLSSVEDNANNACVTRTYSFDEHSNRTGLRSYAPSSNGGCTTSSAATSTTYSYDDGDRLQSTTTAGASGTYAYDTMGRTTSVPAVDAKGLADHANVTGVLTLGYFANNLLASQGQGGSNTQFALDPQLDRFVKVVEGSKTTVNHFDNNGDSPSWTSVTSGGASTWTDYIAGPDGDLAATLNQTGEVTLQLTDLGGNIVATASGAANASQVSSYSEQTEYGLPRNPGLAGRYGWLGNKQRANDVLGGATLMGVRVYIPSTGRFASTDPISGGNANAYNYPDDPVNESDTSGKAAAGHRPPTYEWRAKAVVETWYTHGHWHNCSGHVSRSSVDQSVSCIRTVTTSNTWSITGSAGISVKIVTISGTVGYNVTKSHSVGSTYTASVHAGDHGGHAQERALIQHHRVLMSKYRCSKGRSCQHVEGGWTNAYTARFVEWQYRFKHDRS